MAVPEENSGSLDQELVFPDWSGMKEHAPMSFEQAYKYNQELIAMFPPKPGEEARRWSAKSEVEFVL
ncbi:MAG: hypothetical protein K0Q55_1709 [Verrucomicrobia bacterium]|jgi:hypothetical protein|nr:hypothetical protein [Verrucomicrobiota bacterium]